MPGSAPRHSRELVEQHPLRLGFVPLIDAAPLIAASALGFFSDESLAVSLEKQIGWGNVRDRLTYGELDASHGPIGMAPASLVPLESYDHPLGIMMGLSAGGNAITVAKHLAELGTSENAPAIWRQRLGRPLRMAYVASVGTHHFALLDLLKTAGLTLGHDAELFIMPPAQMPSLLERGVIDGFCAGEPWNTLAHVNRSGSIYRSTTQWAPNHPEKVLLVSRRWHGKTAGAAVSLVRAVLRGCDFCEDETNHARLAELLARPEYLDLDESVIALSLAIQRWLEPGSRRPPFRSFARPITVPRAEHVEWIVSQMTRWGVMPAEVNVPLLVRSSVLRETYDRALETTPTNRSRTAASTAAARSALNC
jgi:ABC-type nitrate/sulfonate/bicarbonate transport system substrate-binding protein